METDVRIFNGNCWSLINTLEDKCVDCIITDPMYDDYDVNMDQLRRVCRGHIIMFCAPEHPFFTPSEYAYWIKTPSTKNYSRKLGRFVEWILIERHGDTFNTNLHWSNYTGVYDDVLLSRNHPYQKPESLINRLISIYSKPGDSVFDPFFGSGQTLLSAHNLGRNAVGCEISPDYYLSFLDSHKDDDWVREI